jgi:hypothetical protein
VELVLQRLLTQQKYKTGENTRLVASAGKNENKINQEKTLTQKNRVTTLLQN